eukprot:CAMPEP_0203858826 /NCGR_PEP_ID=MMETSP0359-20131031/11497_1 /ASSEMBLY_ACC=CAM_ASM_000338 /TAXON_ID=268821 /ORGANISM="Scrippsiella Hangoei, Strain SHTV-5" /LENGTH=54 /DNA_ID=CAMNT_0050775655 /DNA_START=219 /DNA_END=380 /DNA_ORIENTATION=+
MSGAVAAVCPMQAAQLAIARFDRVLAEIRGQSSIPRARAAVGRIGMAPVVRKRR